MPPPQPGPGPGHQPAAGGALAQVAHPQATTVLVIGIISMVACGLLGPVAWKMSNDVLVDMAARPDVDYSNRGTVTAARLCGMIGTGIFVLQLLLAALWLIAWIGLRNGV